MRFSRGDEESELEQSLIQASVLQSSSRAAVFEAASRLGSTLNRFSGPNRSSQAEPKEGGRKSGFLFLFVIVRGYHKHTGRLPRMVWQRANARSAVTAQANRVRSRWRKPLFTRIHD